MPLLSPSNDDARWHRGFPLLQLWWLLQPHLKAWRLGRKEVEEREHLGDR